MTFSTSVWGAQHLNTGQNIQQSPKVIKWDVQLVDPLICSIANVMTPWSLILNKPCSFVLVYNNIIFDLSHVLIRSFAKELKVLEK